ncbi:uncharacterized protein THITE_2113588 [Thermothielavioides terrestris NRRL 8126]|jgi:hypothetical protein|uniref:FAD dependent oxidoreductase domain-containing protein n=1 Tax=Thermothielavioides terrestris (strain ATCC 38088 / NRRL 8126) TaxID=578455 RepID=G2R3C9_THETT|nr:uncharacterized protein THITE_2113588 [Thermothielavioides terrestris NRRL 8126]AEO65940.1 hypothetical protein THITE_2113588 [Thermothielavioides terrestris NRRL 8126]
MALRTFAHMQALHAAHPHTAGITFLKGIEYLEAPGPAYLEPPPALLRDLPGFRLLDPSSSDSSDSFPRDGRVVWGCEYDTWCVNPMVYCAFLLRRFVHRGGRVVQLERELRRPEEAFALPLVGDGTLRAGAGAGAGGGDGNGDGVGEVAAVVNASGTGIVPDPDMTITRGQTCLVAEDCDATVTRQNADGSWTFCVPRGFEGGTIIGGTKELNNWDPKPSVEVRERLLSKFIETYPKILGDKPKLTVIRDIVGRRPTRNGGPRVEGEVVPGAGFVMHAYGLGGRGYELSWGVAEAVVEGVEKHVKGGEERKL